MLLHVCLESTCISVIHDQKLLFVNLEVLLKCMENSVKDNYLVQF